MTLLEQMRIRE